MKREFHGQSFFINRFQIARTERAVNLNRCSDHLMCQLVDCLSWLFPILAFLASWQFHLHLWLDRPATERRQSPLQLREHLLVLVRADDRAATACKLRAGPATARSEERRVGKECRSRWSP